MDITFVSKLQTIDRTDFEKYNTDIIVADSTVTNIKIESTII